MTLLRRFMWIIGVAFLVNMPIPSRAQGTVDTPRVTPMGQATSLSGVLRVELTSHDGALHGQFARLLRAEIHTALAMGRLPLVVLGSPSCGACVALDKAIKDSSVMIEALAGTYVIHVDVDEWPDKERRPLGLVSENGGIPAVIAVDSAGKSIQQAVDIVDIDEKDVIGGMARVIRRLVQAQRSTVVHKHAATTLRVRVRTVSYLINVSSSHGLSGYVRPEKVRNFG